MDWTGCYVKDANGNDLPGQILTLECLPRLFFNLLDWAFIFSGIVALFFIIWAGIKLITSGGDKTKVDEGKKTLTFAIIGLIVILISFFIIRIIGYITGTEACITQFGFDVPGCR